jgi:mRNA-degrading endonuclease RelE of RelBE toxin-antitoxin system
VAAALQIWSPTYCRAFDNLPPSVRTSVQAKVDEMGTRLNSFSHQRLKGRQEFKPRVGDRVLYEFDTALGRIFLHYIGHRREIYKRT